MDILKLMALAYQIAAALTAVDGFNEQLDAAAPGDEVTLDVPDDHEPLWPGRLKGNHKAAVSAITFRKRS